MEAKYNPDETLAQLTEAAMKMQEIINDPSTSETAKTQAGETYRELQKVYSMVYQSFFFANFPEVKPFPTVI